jgi:hypothetical protein
MHSKIQTTLAVHALRALLGLALCALAAAALLVFSVVSHAAESFDDQSFKQAQATGKNDPRRCNCLLSAMPGWLVTVTTRL